MYLVVVLYITINDLDVIMISFILITSCTLVVVLYITINVLDINPICGSTHINEYALKAI